MNPGQKREAIQRDLSVMYHDDRALNAKQMVELIPMFTRAEHMHPSKSAQVNLILELCTKLNCVDVQEMIIKRINSGDLEC